MMCLSYKTRLMYTIQIIIVLTYTYNILIYT